MKDKIVIFGAGNYGEIAAKAMKYEKDILFFIDNNKDMWDSQKLGFCVKPVEEIKKFDENHIQVVIALAHYQSAVLQLEQLGFHNYIYYADVYANDYPCESRKIMDRMITQNDNGRSQDEVKKVKNGWMNHLTQNYGNWQKEYIPSEGKVLDVGCGCGKQMFYWLCQGYDAYGIDCCDWKMEFCHQKIEDFNFPKEWKNHFIFGKGEDLPFGDGEFDMVASWYVLEHVDDWRKCIDEMLRVTKPGGIIRINAPDYRNSYEEHYRVEFGKSIVESVDEFGEFLRKNHRNRSIFDELNFVTTPELLDEIAKSAEERKQSIEIINFEEAYPESAVIRENGKLHLRHRIDLLVRLL